MSHFRSHAGTKLEWEIFSFLRDWLAKNCITSIHSIFVLTEPSDFEAVCIFGGSGNLEEQAMKVVVNVTCNNTP